VSSKEKQFMLLWNAFLHQRHVYADFELPSLLFDFIVSRFGAIQHGNFRLELMCHMMALCAARCRPAAVCFLARARLISCRCCRCLCL
jgi:hypothetical protein